MSTARNPTGFSGRLNAVRLIFKLSLKTYRRGIKLWFSLGGLWYSGFLLFNAERVRPLWPPLSRPVGLGLLNGSGEFG